VTKDDTDPLLSAEENRADLVEPPTDAEMDLAITGNMGHLLVVMKAVKRFKQLLARKRPHVMQGIFGRESRLVTPPHAIRGGSRSQDNHDRRPLNKILVTEGVHGDFDVEEDMQKLPHQLDKVLLHDPAEGKRDGGIEQKQDETKAHFHQRQETAEHHPRVDDPEHHRHVERSFTFPEQDHAKGHAHDPLTDTLFLGLGANAEDDDSPNDPLHPIVSDSPPMIEMNMFEQAYQDEMKRIQERKGHGASLYLNRRVEHREDLRSHGNIVDTPDEPKSMADKLSSLASTAAAKSGGGGGLAARVKEAQALHAEDKTTSDSRGDDVDPPLEATRFDGASDEKSSETVEPALDNTTDLDDHNGAMPGMPGGFPVTPDVEGSMEDNERW